MVPAWLLFHPFTVKVNASHVQEAYAGDHTDAGGGHGE